MEYISVLIWFINFLGNAHAGLNKKKPAVFTQTQDNGIVINLNTKIFTNRRMKMGPGFVWGWNRDNFTEYHYDNTTKYKSDVIKKCKNEGNIFYEKSYCFAKKSELYEFHNYYRVGDPVTCSADSYCSIHVQIPLTLTYKPCINLSLNYEDWVRLLDPKLPPNIKISERASTPERFSISFPGPAKKILIFKPLLWSVYGDYTYESHSIEDKFYYHDVITKFPIVLPDGTLDGIFKLVDVA